MLININESDLDRWKPKTNFKFVIANLLHGDLKPFRNWVWKHLFPHSWKRLQTRINELLKKLSNDMDKFLAYGDSVPYFQPSDNIYSSPPSGPVANSRDFFRNFTSQEIPAILGHPNDKLEFVDVAPGVNDAFFKNIEIPAPRYIWQKIIEERNLKFKQQQFLDSKVLQDYFELIKEEICIATGISKEKLFEGAKLIFPTPIESWQAEYMQNPDPSIEIRARSPGRFVDWGKFRGLIQSYPEPPQNQATMDYMDTIVAISKVMAEAMQGSHKGDILKILEPMTVEKNGVRMLWNDYLKGKREELTATKRKGEMRHAQKVYFKIKAEKHNKLYRTCFDPSCSQDLNFSGFIGANKPKTFKAYRTLKKLWFAKYKSKKVPKISLQFYCCTCSKNNSLRLRL